jgi:hypothetical protein
LLICDTKRFNIAIAMANFYKKIKRTGEKMRTANFALLTIIAFALTTIAQPQPPDLLWTKSYGGIGQDRGYCVKQTSDDGFIITGYRSSTYYQSGIYLIKTDINGIQQWSRVFGEHDDWGFWVLQTSDGGYLITGGAYVMGGNGYDLCLIKTDPQGNQLWFRTYGSVNGENGECVQLTSDGGFIAVGATGSFAGGYDVYLVKTDSLGNQLWSQTYGGPGWDWGYSVQQTTDGGYIIAGFTTAFAVGLQDVYLIKTDGLGNQQWYRTFGGTGMERGYSVQRTADGGYMVAGLSTSFNGGDVYLIKTDESGNQQWFRTYGGTSLEEGYDAQQTIDGGYIIAGITCSYSAGIYDIYLVKTDSLGNQLWYRTFGWNNDDFGMSVVQTSDGGYAIAGFSDFKSNNENVCLIRLEGIPFPVTITLTPDTLPITIPAAGGTYGYTVDIVNSGTTTRTFNRWIDILKPNGSVQSVLSYQVTTIAPGDTFTQHLTQSVPSRASAGTYWNRGFLGANIYNVLSADSFQFTKSAVFNGKGFPIEEWSLSGWGETLEITNNPEESFITHHSSFIISANPNPFNSSVVLRFKLSDASEIELKIFDISGREVAALGTGHWALGEHQVEWNAEELPSGIYFARLWVAGGRSSVQKLLLLK